MRAPLAAAIAFLAAWPLAAGRAQLPHLVPGSGRQPLAAFLQRYLAQPNAAPDTTTRFTAASLRAPAAAPAVVVYISGQTRCGTGGCLLLVLEPTGSTYRVIGRTTITRPPVRVLRSTHHGLPDLSVWVAGGVIRQPYVALLAFDGIRYPSNPTMPPARRASAPSAGQVVIRGDSEGERLYPRVVNPASVLDPATCDVTLPPSISAFLRSEATRGWQVVALSDLVADDQALWSGFHAHQCPGLAGGRFDGTARESYAIALVGRDGRVGHYVEQLVLLRPSGATYSRVVVNGPARVVSPLVVWSLPPGTYTGAEDTAHVTIATDSFVYEKMEASAVQYYLIGGRLHSLVTAY